MPKYLIERKIPNAAGLSGSELQQISQKSASVLRELGPGIQWVESYVTSDAIFCVYLADNEQLIREHGTKGGFPVTSIHQISTTIDPTTAAPARATT